MPFGDGSRRCIEAVTYRVRMGGTGVEDNNQQAQVEANSLLQLFGFKFLLFDFEEFISTIS